ncbi:MAG: hypothetical protein WC384_07540 [Prolixibacteraceae bacterium]|jgi:biotin operon repressor
MTFNIREKTKNLISSTLYDLTHLEINTIIKDDMSCSKLPDSPREILHLIATIYDKELILLGVKYSDNIQPVANTNIFHGEREYKGSGMHSFLDLRENARKSKEKLSSLTTESAKLGFSLDNVKKDIKMLERIEVVSDDIYKLLQKPEVVPEQNKIDFDDAGGIQKFREIPKGKIRDYELNLDLRQFALIKKALDIGTETVVLQTIIGIDGDITSRISRAFADQPITFINDIHHDAINTSVKFWGNLVSMVVGIGKAIINYKSV